ncbi:MAG TPA: NfeD family protein [Blastocatellia bacterium]|nr:NfeD family protein [Blastocatellia bacterium]
MAEIRLNLLLGAITAFKLILGLLAWLVWRSRSTKPGSGLSQMDGLKGKAVTEIEFEGRVAVKGEYWWARSQVKIAEGEGVRVTGLEGLTLEVEPCPEKSVIPRPVSAVEPRENFDV